MPDVGWLKDKFWPWWQANWKWVVFPVGLAGLLAAAIGGSRSSGLPGVDWNKLNDAAKERDRAIVEADRVRDEKLLELAEKNKERLDNLSADQERELEDLADKPIEDVVSWFDKF